MIAARAPVALGENVAEMLHVAPAASVDGLSGQVVVLPKSAAFAPARLMLVIVSGPVPEFVSATACAALVVPTACVPNDTLVGDSVTAGAGGGGAVLAGL